MEPKESKSNRHFIWSIIKSAVRIGAGVTLIKGDLWYTGILLIMAEIFGIAEEI